MNKTKLFPKEQAGKSKKVEQAAMLFSCLSDEQKDAFIKLVKNLLEQNKRV